MKKIAIIGSHGLYAKYGGWDQLVKNLAENNSSAINSDISKVLEKNEQPRFDCLRRLRTVFAEPGLAVSRWTVSNPSGGGVTSCLLR